MDPRLALALASSLGAFSGAALMIATTPDTGVMPAPPPAMAPLAALPPAADTPTPTPSAPVQAPPNPANVPAPADDPWAAVGATDNPFGAPVDPNDPFGAAAAPPTPPPGAIPPRVRPGLIQPGGPYPADVRGIGQMFRDRDEQINNCMTQQGPAAQPGEMAVMLRLHLDADPSNAESGRVSSVEAVQDTDGRYASFTACVQQTLAGAPLNAPSNGTSVVHWSVRR